MSDNPEPGVINKILIGDCIEKMQNLPAGLADCIFADPPYNLQLEGTLMRPNMTRVDAVDDHWDQFGDSARENQFTSFAAYDAFTEQWLSAARHALSAEGTLWVIGSYHNIYRVGRILLDLGFWILNDVVWIKKNPMPNFRGVRMTNAHETILWAKKSKKQRRYTFNHQSMKQYNDNKQMRSDWVIPLCTGAERISVNGEKAHATQKPEALLERVIVASTKVGDLVLDPFFGTGTTGAVAKRLGRNWVGIEQEPQYVEIAKTRLAKVQPEPLEWLLKNTQDAPPLARIPFEQLLALGLLKPGDKLHFGKTNIKATINPDGTLTAKGHTDTLHRLGAYLKGAPSCNGWLYWTYKCPETGQQLPLDTLRQMLRAESEK